MLVQWLNLPTLVISTETVYRVESMDSYGKWNVFSCICYFVSIQMPQRYEKHNSWPSVMNILGWVTYQDIHIAEI